MARILEILGDSDALFRRATREFVRLAREAVATHGRFTVALSGGSTPRGLFAMLARELETVPWERMHVCWSDERHVAPDDPASNYALARRTLLAHVPVPDAQVHRVPTELPDAGAAAEAYEQALRALLPPTARFDLVLLGLGADGHTASLFPHSPALAERERWVRDAPGPPPVTTRITLTPPVLNAAAEVMFLVSGIEKAPAVRAVLEGRHDPARWPAQAIRPADGRVLWLLDTAAGRELDPTTASRGDSR